MFVFRTLLKFIGHVTLLLCKCHKNGTFQFGTHLSYLNFTYLNNVVLPHPTPPNISTLCCLFVAMAKPSFC